MITVRRGSERHEVRRGDFSVWHSFFPEDAGGAPTSDFGVLTTLDELRIPPGGATPLRAVDEAEILTYVYRGALAQQDSTGSSGVVHAGEFQRLTPGRGVRHQETNPSPVSWTHVFRISLRPSEAGLERSHLQQRFPVADRHNVLCVVASPDGRRGSIRLLRDAYVYSSLVESGHHLVHELLPGRSAWLQVITGEVLLQDLLLAAGDGVGVMGEASVSLTAQEASEVLLVDLGPASRTS